MRWIIRLCALSILAAITDIILPDGKLQKCALTIVGLVAVKLILDAILGFARAVL